MRARPIRARVLVLNRPISVYHFLRGALTLCPQLCMGIQPGARFPARSADACPQLCMGISPRRYTEIGLYPPRLVLDIVAVTLGHHGAAAEDGGVHVVAAQVEFESKR